jgi:hypothetical protein
MIGISQTAYAACSGVPASGDALANFEKDPAGWVAKEGNGSLASDIQALAVAASANPDLSAAPDAHYAKFEEALKSGLPGVSSDNAKAIGTALGSLGATCGKTGTEEAAFVTSMQRGIAGSGNQYADTAYGRALQEPQTAATGAGGASSGNGGQTGNGSGNGPFSFNSATDSNFSTPVNGQNYFSAGASSNSSTISGTTSTSGTAGTTTVQNFTLSSNTSTGATSTTDH